LANKNGSGSVNRPAAAQEKRGGSVKGKEREGTTITRGGEKEEASLTKKKQIRSYKKKASPRGKQKKVAEEGTKAQQSTFAVSRR